MEKPALFLSRKSKVESKIVESQKSKVESIKAPTLVAQEWRALSLARSSAACASSISAWWRSI